MAQSDLWNKYFNSLCDYLFIFILKSIEQLKENGELIFICPEYWLNTTHSETLRNYMCVNGFFSDIYLFKEAPLFESVTSSFIIFRYVKKKMYPHNIFKQYEYLNDLYRTHPKAISLEDNLLHDYGIHKIFLKRSKTILPTFFFTIISSLKLLM